MMEEVSIITSLVSLIIAYFALVRALGNDVPVADLYFEKDLVNEAVGKIIFDNPTRRSMLLQQVIIKTPDDGSTIITKPDDNIEHVIQLAMEESRQGKQALVYLRVPPRGSAFLNIELKENTGFECTFKWSKYQHWLIRMVLPDGLEYSKEEIEAMKLSAVKLRPAPDFMG